MKAAKRDRAVLRQYSTKFSSFFYHYSALYGSNVYGWVLLSEEVPHCWNGRAAKSRHGETSPALLESRRVRRESRGTSQVPRHR